ncbi:MAG: DNRLRE domain-containing protein [Planctomycetales bacterium]|nr:DNRLRE domain-containing protein [Planctomycetales bacterium]
MAKHLAPGDGRLCRGQRRGHAEVSMLAIGALAAVASISAIALLVKLDERHEGGDALRKPFQVAPHMRSQQPEHVIASPTATSPSSRIRAEESAPAQRAGNVHSTRSPSGAAASGDFQSLRRPTHVAVPPPDRDAIAWNSVDRQPTFERERSPQAVGYNEAEFTNTALARAEELTPSIGPREDPRLRRKDMAPTASPKRQTMRAQSVDTFVSPESVAQELLATDEYVPFVFQGPKLVDDALISPQSPTTPRGRSARDNVLIRGDATNVFLARFALDSLNLPARDRLDYAALSLFVWRYSENANMRICTFALGQPWDEATVSWRRAAAGRSWRGGLGFASSVGPGPAGPSVLFQPNADGVSANDVHEIQLDVTDIVRAWLNGTPNYGLAVSPVIDPRIDGGYAAHFHFYASEYARIQHTPRLVLLFRK